MTTRTKIAYALEAANIALGAVLFFGFYFVSMQ